MTTANIVSTPNITGNIGSCTTQLTQVYDYSGFWKNIGTNITTNSCTGQVTQTPFSEYAFGGFMIIFFGILIGFIIIAVLFSKYLTPPSEVIDNNK